MKSFLDGEAIEGVFESFSGGRWKAREYRRWVEEVLIGGIEDPFDSTRLKWQQFFGGKGFFANPRIIGIKGVDPPKNYGQGRNWSASLGAEVLKRVREHFEFDAETLKERGTRNHLARRCAITLCSDYAGLSHSEIATMFPMPSRKSVAQTIRRTKCRVVLNRGLERTWGGLDRNSAFMVRWRVRPIRRKHALEHHSGVRRRIW
jgi:hypothetical protein